MSKPAPIGHSNSVPLLRLSGEESPLHRTLKSPLVENDDWGGGEAESALQSRNKAQRQADDVYLGASGRPAAHPLRVVEKLITHNRRILKERLMDLARGLKFNSDLPSVDEAEIWFYKWAHGCGKRVWKSEDEIDAWHRIFRRRWEIARWGLGADLASIALAESKNKKLPARAHRYKKSPRMQQVVAMLKELQNMTSPRPFSISVRQLGDLFHAHYTTAGDWLKRLEKDGVITCVERGKPGAPGSKATRYRFND